MSWRHLSFASRPRFYSAYALFLAFAASCNAGIIAYADPSQNGNQAYSGDVVGVFMVNTPIIVTAIGAFDGGTEDFIDPISVAIYTGAGVLVSPDIAFSGAAYQFIGGDGFASVSPLLLGVGNYQLVANGYGSNNEEGNQASPNPLAPPTLNDGNGAITFQTELCCGSPGNEDSDNSNAANNFNAGTFEFSVAPEPGTLSLLAAGGCLLVWLLRRSTASATETLLDTTGSVRMAE